MKLKANYNAQFRYLADSCELKLPAIRTLFHIEQTPGIAQKDIGEDLGLSRPMVSRYLIDLVEDLKFVRFEKNLDDPRENACYITKAGENFIKGMQRAMGLE